MCGVKSAASCRLCLASDLLPPYLDLSQDTSGQVLELCSVLALDLTVCPPHFPQLVCAICLGTVQSFLKLKDTARLNEDQLRWSLELRN